MNYELTGACAIGIARLDVVPEVVMEGYRQWLAEGHQAGMAYMANHEAIRRDPRLLLEGAQSIISIAFPYPDGHKRLRSLPDIASYAMGSDYHDTLRTRLTRFSERLKADLEGEWRICIDSAPIFERYWAERCGVGKRADNGLIAVPGFGTRVFLAEIITTMAFEELSRYLDLEEKWKPADLAKTTDPASEANPYVIYSDTFPMECTHCGACRRVCPAGALQEDSTVDARRCLSYLTIEHRGDWDETGERAMSTPAGRNTLFGCDLCQRVCPMNRVKTSEAAILPELLPRPEILTLTAEDVLAMDQAEFSRRFKSSPIKRTKLAGLSRNAGNCL